MDQIEALIFVQKAVAELNAERQRQGLSMGDLAEVTGMSEADARGYLEGGQMMTLSDLGRFCAALGVSSFEILARAEQAYQETL